MKKQDSDCLSPALVLLLSVATGLSVACNYYIQPLLETIAEHLRLSVGQAGLVVTLSQLSYGFGLFFILPIGDKFEKRSLIVVMSFLTALGMLIIALSQNFWQILIGVCLTGLFSVVVQLLVPFAALLAGEHQKGKVLGQVMSGLLLGILLARTVSGALSSTGNWHAVYWVACILLVVQSFVLWYFLPQSQAHSHSSYIGLLKSVLALWCRHSILRLCSILGSLTFAIFSAFWTAMVFLLAGEPFHYSDSMIGLFGLVGAFGAFMATLAGKMADKGKSELTMHILWILFLPAWGLLFLAKFSILLFILGIIIMDMAAQGIHITNQGIVYRLIPEQTNQANAVYMVSYFIGGSLGSLAGAYAYHYGQWPAVCVLGLIISLLGLAIWLRSKSILLAVMSKK